MMLKKLILNLSFISCSILFAICAFELTVKYVDKKNVIQKQDSRYLLFSDLKNRAAVFENKNQIFSYLPNLNINAVAYYFVGDKWVKEYDYIYPTNNLGLVQSNKILKNKPSLLLLGDSFTEGQGSYPWFEKFSRSVKKKSIQYVNGGILGTGFHQWELLHNNLLENDINIHYVVIPFISGDAIRGVWNILPATNKCIENYKTCKGDENFYGMPEQQEMISFLNFLRDYRSNPTEISIGLFIKNSFKNYFPATYLCLSFLREKIGLEKIRVEENKKSITRLVKRYQNKILFIHLPQKNEILSGKFTDIGIEIDQYIIKTGGKLVNGLNKCGLREADYMPIDGHPNVTGYQKISDCVATSVSNDLFSQINY